MKKRFSKRVTSLVLTIAMLVTAVPLSSLTFFAATVEEDSAVPATVTDNPFSDSAVTRTTTDGVITGYSVNPISTDTTSKVVKGIAAAKTAIGKNESFYAKIMVSNDGTNFKYLGLDYDYEDNSTINDQYLTVSDIASERADLYWEFEPANYSVGNTKYSGYKITSVVAGFGISPRKDSAGTNWVWVDDPSTAGNSSYENVFNLETVTNKDCYNFKNPRGIAKNKNVYMCLDSTANSKKITVTASKGTTNNYNFYIQKVVVPKTDNSVEDKLIEAPINFEQAIGNGYNKRWDKTTFTTGTLRYIRANDGTKRNCLPSNVYNALDANGNATSNNAINALAYDTYAGYKNQEMLWKVTGYFKYINNATSRSDVGLHVFTSAFLQNAALSIAKWDNSKLTTYSAGTDGLSSGDTDMQWYIYEHENGTTKGTYVRLQSRTTGQFLDISDINNPTMSDTPVYAEVRGTDGKINTVKENIKMHLFDYGQMKDTKKGDLLFDGMYGTVAGRPLDFRNISTYNPFDYMLKGSNSDYFKTGLFKGNYIENVNRTYHYYSYAGGMSQEQMPDMKQTLASGYPLVESIKVKTAFSRESTLSEKTFNKNGGYNLEYLFKPDTNDFNDFRTEYEIDYVGNGKTGLFQKTDNGYYYYDSRSNAAWYDADSESFHVGDFITTPKGYYTNSNDDNYIGGFFPFNTPPSDGTVRYSNNPADDGKVYTFANTGSTANTVASYTMNYDQNGASYGKRVNYWFGMTMEFDFTMTADGKISYYDETGKAQSEEMIFSFAGDDDVWVYIDDVLVLDIGGTHGRRSGNINFATGVASDYAQTDKTKDATRRTRTLKSIFSAPEANKDSTYKGANFDSTSDTFKPGTQHTLKFFYLERGGAASNCQIYFNMQPMQAGVSEELQVPVGSVLEDEKDEKEFYIGFSTTDASNKTTNYIARISENDNQNVYGKLKELTAGTTIKVWEYNPKTLPSAYAIGKANFSSYTGTFNDPKFNTGSGDVTKSFVDSFPKTLTDTEKNGLINNGITTVASLAYPGDIYATSVKVDNASNLASIHITNETTEDFKVQIKYYDRNVRNNTVAQINETETTYNYTAKLTANSDTTLRASLGTIVNEAAKAVNNKVGIGNIVDKYTFWSTQTAAVDGIQSKTNQNQSINAKYGALQNHTTAYGQPQESSTDKNCNWVNYFDGNAAKLAATTKLATAEQTPVEANSTAYNTTANSVRKVVVWLYNELREYNVTWTALDVAENDVASANLLTENTDKVSGNVTGSGNFYVANNSAKFKSDKAYYNQRFGGRYEFGNDANLDAAGEYLNKYGISGYKNTLIESTDRVTLNGAKLKFLYWSDSPDGSTVFTTDRKYGYRITCGINLYAVYGPEGTTVNTGVHTVKNNADTYIDSTGKTKARINTILTPYGSSVTDSDTNIGYMAVCYAKEQVSKDDIESKITSIGNYSDYATAKPFTIGSVSTQIIKYQAVTYGYTANENYQLQLTNKNRVQFTSTIDKSTLDKSTIYVYTAMKYGDKWIVSDSVEVSRADYAQ